MSTLSVLISTMNRESLDFLDDMNLDGTDFVVINQYSYDKGKHIVDESKKSRVTSVMERGLSRSRNRAIDLAQSEICVLADDDIRFVNGFQGILIELFDQYPEADLIIYDYNTQSAERSCNSISNKVKQLSMFDLLNVSSVRISFRRRSITERGIRFDTRFGAGSTFPAGEENLFLKDCFDAGLKIIYIPIVICEVDFGESSWFNGFTKSYFEAKGTFSNVFFKSWKGHLYLWYFAIAKWRKYKEEISFSEALRALYVGFRKADIGNAKKK